jgi:hypothetical protein
MHTVKINKKNYKKEKSRYSDQFPVSATLTPPRQQQKSSFSKSDASKKFIVCPFAEDAAGPLRLW